MKTSQLAAWPVSLGNAGYIQVVDYDSLVKLASKSGLGLEVGVRAGHHVLKTGEHVTVFAPTRPGKNIVAKIRAAFTIGGLRTPAQDPEQGIRHLVEIATRALSPGTNDPFTALTVIDRLGTALALACGRFAQQRVYRDDRDTVRVIANRTEFSGLLDAAFHPIRQAGGDHPEILIALADLILRLTPSVRNADHSQALARQLDRLTETAALGRITPLDRQDILARITAARQMLATAAVP